MHIHTIKHKKYIDKEKESSESLTSYVSPGYGGHGVMEGYNETRMGNKELY